MTSGRKLKIFIIISVILCAYVLTEYILKKDEISEDVRSLYKSWNEKVNDPTSGKIKQLHLYVDDSDPIVPYAVVDIHFILRGEESIQITKGVLIKAGWKISRASSSLKSPAEGYITLEIPEKIYNELWYAKDITIKRPK